MRQPASPCRADQRRREIELAFAYIFGPALTGQRIILDVLAASIAPPSAAATPQTADEALSPPGNPRRQDAGETHHESRIARLRAVWRDGEPALTHT